MAHDTSTGRVDKVKIPGVYNPTSVAISRDGDLVAFVSAAQGFRGTALFALRRSTGKVQNIGHDSGLHSDPFVAADNATVYFSFHSGYGKTESHDAQKEWAQIHKTSADGGGAIALTSSRGCHLAPGGASRERIFFVYSPCNGRRFLSFMPLEGGEETRIPIDGKVRNVIASHNGDDLILVVERLGYTDVEQYSIKSRTSRRIARARVPTEVRAGFGHGNTIYVQQGESVWMHRGGKAPVEVRISEVQQ